MPIGTEASRLRRRYAQVGRLIVAGVAYCLAIDPVIADDCREFSIHSTHLESVVVDSNVAVVSGKPNIWGVTMRAVEVGTGRERWVSRAHFSIGSALSPRRTLGFPRDVEFYREYVLSAGTDGSVEARATETGDLQWRLRVANEPLWKLTISSGMAFVAGRDGSVTAIDLETQTILWSRIRHQEMVRSVVHASELGAVVSAGFDGLVAVSNEPDGELLWEMSFPFRIKSALYSNGLVLVAPWREDGADVKAYSFDKKNLIWARSWHDHLADGYRGKHHGVEEMIVHDGQVFTAGDDGQVVAADATSGRPLWNAVGSGQSARAVTVSNGNLVFVDRGGVLTICALP